MKCYVCGGKGHKAKDCPQTSQSFEPLAASEVRVDDLESFTKPARPQKVGVAPIVLPASVIPEQERERRPAATPRNSRRAEDRESNQSQTPGRNSRRRSRFADEEEFDFDEDEEFDTGRRVREAAKKRKKSAAIAKTAQRAGPIPVILPEFISVANLATTLGIRMEDFIAKMEELGFIDIAYDQLLAAEDAGLIAQEYGFDPLVEDGRSDEDLYPSPVAVDTSHLPQRPPVVTIMGHVDHGKTTILDFLRKSSIAAGEHGGITQHIGAFVVPLSSGKAITFLDTPGHAAFLSMRQRGASVTDIVVLVVAADDSVMPQTIEAIKHAKVANVPIIVAVNKCDKEEANPDRVKKDLSRHDIFVEDFGGDTQAVCVSGKTGMGMEELEEAVVTLSEILDHRAPTDGQVEGWILESTTKDRGKVATVLVRCGTLKLGDIIVAGTAWARVRALRNEAGVMVKSAGPGTPVEVDGWKEQPNAGDEVLQSPSESKASSVVEYRQTLSDRLKMIEDMEAINLSRRLQQEKRDKEADAAKARENGEEEPETEEQEDDTSSGPIKVPFLVKGDVGGSAEAVVNSVSNIGNAEIHATVLRSGIGPITPSDIDYASAVGAQIISFNLPVPSSTRLAAERAGVKILDQSIIYRVVENVTALLSEKLPPRVSQKVLGEAEVAQIFELKVTKGAKKQVKIAGCKVRNGMISRGKLIRVFRGKDKEVVYDGEYFSCFWFYVVIEANMAVPQDPCRRSRTSRRTSRKCVKIQSAVWASRIGMVLRLEIRFRRMRMWRSRGIYKISPKPREEKTENSNSAPPRFPDLLSSGQSSLAIVNTLFCS
jgi:translation initiation factor IF-2